MFGLSAVLCYRKKWFPISENFDPFIRNVPSMGLSFLLMLTAFASLEDVQMAYELRFAALPLLGMIIALPALYTRQWAGTLPFYGLSMVAVLSYIFGPHLIDDRVSHGWSVLFLTLAVVLMVGMIQIMQVLKMNHIFKNMNWVYLLGGFFFVGIATRVILNI